MSGVKKSNPKGTMRLYIWKAFSFSWIFVIFQYVSYWISQDWYTFVSFKLIKGAAHRFICVHDLRLFSLSIFMFVRFFHIFLDGITLCIILRYFVCVRFMSGSARSSVVQFQPENKIQFARKNWLQFEAARRNRGQNVTVCYAVMFCSFSPIRE